MKSMHAVTALATLMAFASPAAAQRVQVYETTPRPDVVLRTPGAMTYTTSRRAIIGVTIDTRPSANDSVGATVAGVTPSGPAADAGLLAGDIITKVDGTALVDRRRRTEDDGPAAPGTRLIELIARVEPGDTVAVEWKRGNERQRRNARVVTEPAAGMVMRDGPGFRVYTDEGPGRFKFNFEDGPQGLAQLQGRLDALRGPMALPGMDGDHLFLRFSGPFGGIQFAPLNADLGRYFGTSDGILVLETPDSSAHVDFKGGDVILSVGDRKPTSVEHLFRILGSYEDEETISFDVMRDKRHVTITAKAEDVRGGGERVRMLERTLAPPVPDLMEPVQPAPRTTQPRRTPRSGT